LALAGSQLLQALFHFFQAVDLTLVYWKVETSAVNDFDAESDVGAEGAYRRIAESLLVRPHLVS
jgi:hypothetical protein